MPRLRATTESSSYRMDSDARSRWTLFLMRVVNNRNWFYKAKTRPYLT